MIATITETALPVITVTITRLCRNINPPISHHLSVWISKKITRQHVGLNSPGNILEETAGT
jgi:hypothetical protein